MKGTLFNIVLPCIIIMLISFGIVSKAQVVATHFAYDQNGNRIQNWVTIYKMTDRDSVGSSANDTISGQGRSKKVESFESVRLYPNPTPGILELKISDLNSGEGVEYVIYSTGGLELLRKKVTQSPSQINIETYSPGTYLIKITRAKGSETWKIIKY